MAFEKAKQYLTEKGYGDRVLTFDVSSATVALAAKALGTEEARIAKSLTFLVNGEAVMIICAGDAKVTNGGFKSVFHTKAVMLNPTQVSEMIGHEVGGVCPFGINPGVRVFLDTSLRRFDTVYPACGSSSSAVRLTVDELEALSGSREWISVCSIPEQNAE